MLGAPKTDWTAAYAKARGAAEDEAATDWHNHQAERDEDDKPSLPLADSAGTYTEPWYGDVEISRQGKTLDAKGVGEGKRVTGRGTLGGRRLHKKKKKKTQ